MTYGKHHTINHCDKCEKLVGKNNLKKVPFLYMDKNDKSHPDMSYTLDPGTEPGYRQYYICKECEKNGI